MRKIRILLLEDNRLLRDGITSMLNGQADIQVIASSSGNKDPALQIEKLRPHVVLIDLGLRNQNGLGIVKSLLRKFSEIKVIGMGLIPTQEDVIEFVQAGASGFILKDATVMDFLNTIRLVTKGANVLPSVLNESLFSHVVAHALKRGKGTVKESVQMTKRELEVIALIAESLSNKEIAERLNIATFTVKSHVHNVLEKLTLRSRLQIAQFARDFEDS